MAAAVSAEMLVRQRHQLFSRHDADIGVSPDGCPGIGHPLAWLHFGYTGADRLDHPGALHARGER